MSVLALSMISQKFKLNFYKILMNANSFRGKEKAKKKKTHNLEGFDIL